ncbi:hypothetical protein Bphyt_7339 (plasmid) [Paraburkholderia phytofirmans PsJN]|uniref:Uncharacterized protein n=1 Tax=Paraburkholderia phytofirmans (strain DSM 17436 / LMG 22146 / PsJN) TaxID=398527 RepID=B2TH79_PARPJ|nr:hypothetical protein Bphyt_7339 [Paraburkholderia phytofirmans PsJN]
MCCLNRSNSTAFERRFCCCSSPAISRREANSSGSFMLSRSCSELGQIIHRSYSEHQEVENGRFRTIADQKPNIHRTLSDHLPVDWPIRRRQRSSKALKSGSNTPLCRVRWSSKRHRSSLPRRKFNRPRSLYTIRTSSRCGGTLAAQGFRLKTALQLSPLLWHGMLLRS